MEEQLETLNYEFSIVKENIHTIILNSASIKTKIEKLRNIYSEMISANSYKKIFLFCLESFNFQIKSFSVDNENLNKSLLLISNRVYCDYYKLFKLIKTLFEEYKYDVPKKISEPPVYDILNPFFEYSVDDISKMHDDVCLLLYALIDYFNNNCDNIMAYTSKSQSGICIANFIKTLEYDNSVLKDQINLYLGYMDFFKSTQTKYLVKLLNKMELLKKEINDEINDDIDPPPPPNNTSEDDSDESDGPYLELTSPVKNAIISHVCVSSVSSVASITNNASITNSPISSNASVLSEASEANSYISSNASVLSEASDDSYISQESIASIAHDSSVATTSTEKKNENFVEQNAEEKPAKKKGRPRTKDVVKTKFDKKKEVTDSEGCVATDTVKDSTECVKDSTEGVKDSTEGVKDSSECVKDSSECVKNSTECVKNSTEGVKNSTEGVKNSTEGVKDSSEDFGITIDQIHDHANTMSMVISEK
jgi:hypothetical protein